GESMPADLVSTGLDDVLNTLSDRFSKARMDRIVSAALSKEADEEVEEIKKRLKAAYSDTGISAEGVTHGKISRTSGYPVIKIGNNGEHWPLIHLNEYGYTQYGKYRPGAGHGVLTKFVVGKVNIMPIKYVRVYKEQL
ncbi:hypothetical protein ACN9TB_01055, partial [Lactococcus lactis]